MSEWKPKKSVMVEHKEGLMNPFKWLAWKISQRIWEWAYFSDPVHEWWLYHSMMWIIDYSPQINGKVES